MSNEIDDNSLLESARKGDREAFRMLVERNSRRLYSLAWRILGDEHAAEDVVQEAFIKAYKKIRTFDGHSRVSTWLYRITVNTAIDMQRKMKRQKEVTIDDENNHIDILDKHSTPENYQKQEYLKKETERAMQQLTIQERTTFTLKHHDGYSIDEICHILQLSESSVKQAIFRSVKKLRQSLAPLIIEQGQG